MVDSLALFDRCQQLAQNHAQQFDPIVAGLRATLEQELQQISQQERAIVEAQTEALQELKTAIATDARFLISTQGFQDFLESLPEKPVYYWRSRDRLEPQLATNPTDWLLLGNDQPLKVMNYEMDVDHDDYDDERTHTSYFYTFDVEWGDQSVEVERVTFKKAYGVQDGRNYTDRDQIESISYSMEDFFDRKNQTQDQVTVVEEMSCLVFYACSLLKQQPRTVQFIYDSREITPSGLVEEN